MDKEQDLSQSIPANNSADIAQTISSLETEDKLVSKRPGRWLIIFLCVALLIALGTTSIATYYSIIDHQNIQDVTDLSNELRNMTQQLNSLQANFLDTQQKISKNINNNQQLSQQLQLQTTQQNQLESAIQQLKSQLNLQQQQFENLKQQVNTEAQINSPQQHMLRAELILQQAAVQIWTHQNIADGISLLEKALMSLQTLQLKALQPVIHSIQQEIQALKQVSAIPLQERYATLQQLINSVDSLPLGSVTVTNHSGTDVVTDSINDWKSNLLNSWHKFLQDFIRVTPRDPLSQCLQTANSDTQRNNCQLFKAITTPRQLQQLQMNFKSELLLATQALFTQQATLFHDTLETLINWTSLYFDVHQASTQQFLSQLTALQQAKLFPQVNYPLTSSMQLSTLLTQYLLSSSQTPDSTLQ